MPSNIETLDPIETEEALAGHRFNNESTLSKIAERLMTIVDSEASVFVSGLTESTINSLRTRMYRRDVTITVRKIIRNGERGHVILAKHVEPQPR
jgi:hypothetical protein